MSVPRWARGKMRAQPDAAPMFDERLRVSYAPASTGLLVASIIFANKLWVLDVTLMSLYWVARLPIERPKKQTSPLAPKTSPSAPQDNPASAVLVPRRRPLKIALSLAIVAALSAPFVFRTYKAHPTYSVWVPLTAQQKVQLAASLRNSNYCHKWGNIGPNSSETSIVAEWVCRSDIERYEEGGYYEYYFDDLKYIGLNVGAAVAAFVSVFAVALFIPILIRRYWRWLNA